jgi:hypothetical protein
MRCDQSGLAKSPATEYMQHSFASSIKRRLHHAMRRAFGILPRKLRFAVYRAFVNCDPQPDSRLVLKIADTKEELEACFRLLHDAYVGSGFMRPDPSGMRATIYHALPTTTTLCAKFDGEVVGTLSLIRESVFGFPLQSVFNLHQVRARGGQIAEVSALAVHPKFRKTGGSILFPLMKFMYEYCTNFFDTRHLVIAVNPDRIEMYESLLFFKRLEQSAVDNYDFANGAPAIGASLDLQRAESVLKQVYNKKSPAKNLYAYFVRTRMKNIIMPSRRYFTTNDPVMTPDLLDYFFNECTTTFSQLDERHKSLLHSIYDTEKYHSVLPTTFADSSPHSKRRKHQRYSLMCPGKFAYPDQKNKGPFALRVVELSETGFLAYSKQPLRANVWGEASIQLGNDEKSTIKAKVIRGEFRGSTGFYGFKLEEPDLPWRKFVGVLHTGATHEDLTNATQFLSDGQTII